jgi:hypothetical protein
MTTTISGHNDGGSVIWQGFDYGWQGEPHRISRFDSHLDSFALQSDGKVHARYLTAFGVGNVDDVGDAFTYVASVKAMPFHFIYGYTSQTLAAEQGTPTAVDGERVSVVLPEGLGAGVVATPLLRGFGITSANFEPGFHTRGFGVELNDPRLEGNSLSFVPRFFVHAEQSPDPLTQGIFSKAPQDYRYTMTANFTIVAAPASAAYITVAPSPAPTVVARYQGPGTPQEVNALMLGQRDGAFSRAVIGVRGFRWQLKPWSPTNHDGRYLRRLQCFVSNHGYNPETGTATFIAHLWFTNQGAVPYGFDAEHLLWTTLVQFNDNRPVLTTALRQVVDTSQTVEAVQDFAL